MALLAAVILAGLPIAMFKLGAKKWPRFMWLGTGAVFGVVIVPLSYYSAWNLLHDQHPFLVGYLGMLVYAVHVGPFDPMSSAEMMIPAAVWTFVYGGIGLVIDLVRDRFRSE